MPDFISNIKEINYLLSNDKLPGRLNRNYLKEKVLILKKILYGLDAIIFIHDLNSNHQVWTNGNYLKTLGYSEEEILHFGLDEARSLFHPDDLKIILEGIELFRSNKTETFSCIYRIKHKLGQWVWMYYHAGIMERDGSGVPIYILGLAVDFSPHIRSEKHLNELIAENRRQVNQFKLNSLTVREKEIIIHLTEGLTCKEISSLLGISYYTTETHLKNIHQKLCLYNLAALINFAVESGLKA